MRRTAVLLLVPALLVAAACTGAARQGAPAARTSPREARASAAVPFTDWTTYHRTRDRAGVATNRIPGRLAHVWRARLRGAVYGEPLVVGSTLVAATERNNVVALNARTGAHRWRVHLGTPQPLSALPCGNIDPLGITGTPAYDRATNTVFVVAETAGAHHTLWAINASTGGRRWHRSLDLLSNRDRHAEQQRTALLVVGGRVIATFGGLAGDCGNYVGYVTSSATNGRGTIHHYAVPTPREAGIWSPPGPSRGANGHIYVSTGNGARTSGTWDKSDSVTELTPVRLRRLSVFAPATWREDNAADADLGSGAPAHVGDRIVIAGKRGRAYLLGQTFHGVGSALATLDGCRAFSGGAVSGRSVLMPCIDTGIRRLDVGRHSLSWGWRADGVYGSPVIAGGRVYVADRNSQDMVVLSLADGHEVYRVSRVGPLTHFPSVTISGGMAFVPTLGGITALGVR